MWIFLLKISHFFKELDFWKLELQNSDKFLNILQIVIDEIFHLNMLFGHFRQYFYFLKKNYILNATLIQANKLNCDQNPNVFLLHAESLRLISNSLWVKKWASNISSGKSSSSGTWYRD